MISICLGKTALLYSKLETVIRNTCFPCSSGLSNRTPCQGNLAVHSAICRHKHKAGYPIFCKLGISREVRLVLGVCEVACEPIRVGELCQQKRGREGPLGVSPASEALFLCCVWTLLPCRGWPALLLLLIQGLGSLTRTSKTMRFVPKKQPSSRGSCLPHTQPAGGHTCAGGRGVGPGKAALPLLAGLAAPTGHTSRSASSGSQGPTLHRPSTSRVCCGPGPMPLPPPLRPLPESAWVPH